MFAARWNGSHRERGWIGLFLALVVAFGSFGWVPAAKADAVPGESYYDFENFAVGPLNGQNGWTNASPEVTVTDQVYAVSGTKTVKVLDNDKTKAMGARLAFPAIRQGSVEWWAKPETADRLVMLLESTGPQGTKPVEWIGFLANRTIEYYDGASRLTSSETYEPGKWYRFRVDFDAAAGKKTISVFDGDKPLLVRKNTAFRDTSASTVNQFRLATISTSLGTFYIDNVRIRDASLVPAGTLQTMKLLPESVNLQVGQTKQVNVFGEYSNGDVKVMDENQISFVSANPEVATAQSGLVKGLSAGATVISAVYGGVKTNLDVKVYGAGDVPPFKQLPVRLLQPTTSLSGLRIVVPDEAGWQSLGQEIAAALQSRWHVQATIAAPQQEKFRDGWAGNTLLLGSLGNNEQMARMYGLRMSYADAVYPGDGGYQLQTVIDPFGLGGNTVVLGASDLAGARAGVDRLLQIVGSQTEPTLPWLAEAKLSDQAASYLQNDGKPTPANIESALRSVDVWLSRLKPTTGNETDADNLLYVFSRIKIFGENYLLSGDPGFGEVYRKLLKGYADFINRYPAEARSQLNNRVNMWTDGDTVIQNWAVLEASPVFNQLEREQINSAFYLTYEANAKDGYLAGAAAFAPRWNHEIFPALSLISGADYFRKYYALPETSQWNELGERIFTGNTSYISLDEGSDYLMHVPMTNIDYAMATGNLEFMMRSLRPSADLNALMIDNLGVMTGGGDTYPFGYSNAYSWGHSQVMNAATWLYGDPVYRFLLERTRTGPFAGQRMSDLDYPIHRYMAVKDDEGTQLPEGNYPKLQAYPVEQGVYDDLKSSEQAQLDVTLDDTFHKMTFREGFDLDDSYLVVDGFSAGSHGHQDGNAILSYTADGRLFLTDKDYIENTPEHHSGLVVVKNGEQEKKPPLASLQWAADLGGIAVSRSSVPNYNGTDWQRSIISPNGQFYLIYDDVKFNEAGDYVLKNNWQTLGSPNVHGNKFEAEQQGVTMTIQNLDGSELLTQDRYGHFLKYWEGEYKYPYADSETVLSEVKEEQGYKAGEQKAFINVLSSRKEKESAVESRRLSDTAVEIRQKNERWMAISAELNTDFVESDGKFHLIGEGKLLAADVTRIRIGTQTLNFSEPVFFTLDVATGEWSTHSLRKDRVQYDSNGEPIREVALETGRLAWTAQSRDKLEQLMEADAWENELSEQDSVSKSHSVAAASDWEELYRFPEQVTDSAWGDLNSDGQEELVLGGAGGKVQAVDQEGVVRWTFAAAGRVNEVTVQQLNGRPVVFVATENWYVHALDAQGTELWSYRFPSDAEHRERKGNLLGITNVRVAHMNGEDQEPWVMVGTQFRYIYGLDSNGQLKYENLLYFYGIEDMEFADFDGDGKDEGVYGLEYAYYAYLNELQEVRGGTGGGPGWKVAAVLPAADRSTPSILLGTKQNEVKLIRFEGKLTEKWSQNVGGEVNDIRQGDFNGDGTPEILAGTDGLQFYALNSDGTVRFRKALEDRVLQVDGWNRDGQTHYWAAADHGLLVELSDQGDLEKTVRFRDNIASLHAGAAQAKPWIVLSNGEVYRYRR